MSGGVVSLLRCVFFYFCREHKLVPPLGQRGFSLVMCGSAGLHYSPDTRAREADRETKVKKKIISERHHPVASDEKTMGWFFIHMGIECTIEKSHKPSVLKHHIVLLNGGNKGGKQTVRPQFVVRDIFRLCCDGCCRWSWTQRLSDCLCSSVTVTSLTFYWCVLSYSTFTFTRSEP